MPNPRLVEARYDEMQFSEAVDIEKWEEPIARAVIPSPPSAATGREASRRE
jgi:hypothetical protein